MELLINKDSIALINKNVITLMKPDRKTTRFILTSLNRNIITSYVETRDVKNHYKISYVMQDLTFTFKDDSYETYSDIINLANMKRMRDILNEYKKAINSNIKTHKIIVLPLSKTKNVSTFIESDDTFTYQTFNERKELIYLNKMIDMYIKGNGVLSNSRGVIVSGDKRLIGVDDYTKDIIDRKVLSYGKKF